MRQKEGSEEGGGACAALRLTHQHPLDRNGANKDAKTADAWKEYDIALVKIREEMI